MQCGGYVCLVLVCEGGAVHVLHHQLIGRGLEEQESGDGGMGRNENKLFNLKQQNLVQYVPYGAVCCSVGQCDAV